MEYLIFEVENKSNYYKIILSPQEDLLNYVVNLLTQNMQKERGILI